MNRPFLLGLTGSIGMGKSTTAQMFRELGVPVWDADAAVHRIYESGGAGASAVAVLCPAAIRDDAVDRVILKDWIAADPARLKRLEAAIHPLVAADRARFVALAQARGDRLVVLDIPLLYETGADQGMDGVLVVSAPASVQRERVLARAGMSEGHFETILARQLSDAEKRARATYVIETEALEPARRAVQELVERLKAVDA